ncbi:hypothetical protein BC835DRAFT_1419951 [Cytidiella melzeri]|nr:hypothetical protein BC835DRAFT_1419951 [Cytidiella melzeri]
MSSSRSESNDDGALPPTAIVHESPHVHRAQSRSDTERSASPPRSPTITRHPARLLSLPTPHLVGSIASGAHYAGALSPPHNHLEHGDAMVSVHHRRSFSRGGHDLAVEQAYSTVLADLEQLFCGRVTYEILDRRFAEDIQFESPWSKCVGFAEAGSQFVALKKLYAKCERRQFRILSASLKPNELVFSHIQVYTLRIFGTKRIVTSFVHVDLDDEFKIVRIVDQWDGEELPASRGMLWLRKFQGKVTPWFFPVPKRGSVA